MKVNLGCPVYCEGYQCVDLFPKDVRVIRSDAVAYLEAATRLGGLFEEVRSENLLEHLSDVGRFLRACYGSLVEGGRVVVVTDNAEWLPFYLPVDLRRLGVGAHARESYALRFNTVHYAIYSKMHLRAHLRDAGFSRVRVRRLWSFAFARIEGIGWKEGNLLGENGLSFAPM